MSQLSLSQFADKMNMVIPAIMKEFARRQADELYKGNITLPQFLILEFLRRQGECKMTLLANYMNVTTAAMTGIVDRLVRDGYVVRANEPEDRRIIKIKLTFRGEALVKKVSRQRRRMIINIFAKISQAQRQDYLRILLRIYDILIKEKRNKI